MHISGVDRAALEGHSMLHRASAAAKLAALALVLTSAVLSWNVLLLAAVVSVLLAAAVACRLDMRLTLGLATYPALFAALFAFASAPSAMSGVTIVAKAVTAALAAVTLVLTTPYPQIFSQAQRLVPGIVGDALLMTYRTFFLLADRFSDMLRAVRIRSGTRPGGSGALRTARMVGAALGGLVLYAIELAERDYDVLYVRGYSGRLKTVRRSRSSAADDALVLGAASLLAAVSLLWRFGWVALNPFSWIPLAAGLVLLAAAALWRYLYASRA